jgi:hypothetical protein
VRRRQRTSEGQAGKVSFETAFRTRCILNAAKKCKKTHLN